MPQDPEPITSHTQIEMSGQQRALYEALVERSEVLAHMYLAALEALTSSNPVRYSLAGHSIRELMNNAPKFLDIPVPAKTTSLTPKVMELSDQWKAAQKSAGLADGKWSGTIDGHLGKFLGKAAAFFDWFSTEHPQRKEKTATLLRGLDQQGKRLPGPIEKLRINEWEECHSFFVRVAHHSNPSGFEDRLEIFERFLLDRLRPRTYADRAAIDALIEEGERDA